MISDYFILLTHYIFTTITTLFKFIYLIQSTLIGLLMKWLDYKTEHYCNIKSFFCPREVLLSTKIEVNQT